MNPSEPAPPAETTRLGAAALSTRLGERSVPAWAAAMLVMALWLIARPYRGVRHDGVLYLGQTLARWMPGTIGRDLFLSFGSQDRYSIFSTLMAPLVRSLDVAPSQIAMLVLSQLAFVAAAWWLTADMPSRTLRWCSLLSLAALSHTYPGGGGAFAFAEPFFSARSTAEPFALLAIALALRGRKAWAVLSIAVAMSLHVLIALPALVVIWIGLSLQNRRWLAAVLVVIPVAGIGALGVPPFAGLWQVYDPAWWAQVQATNADVFMQSSRSQDWGTAAFDICIIYFAARQLAGASIARMLWALLVAVPMMTGLWAVGADLFHNVLLTQLQLWRIFWLTHLFALLLLPAVMAAAWQRGPIGRWAAAAIALGAVSVSANLTTVPLCILWMLLPCALLRFGSPVSATLARLALVVSVLAALLLTILVGWKTRSVVLQFPDRFNATTDIQVVLGLSIVVAVIGFGLLRGLTMPGLPRWLSSFAVLMLAGLGTSSWDQRSDWQRFVESGLRGNVSPFAAMVPMSATVYWDGNSLLEPWLLMQRPQFFARDQGSGLLFSRPTALEFARRENVIQSWAAARELCMTLTSLTGADSGSCYPAPDMIQSLCHASPHPDFMVFEATKGSEDGGASAVWSYRPDDLQRKRTYRLYDCARQP